MLLENPHEKHMRKSRLQKRILPHFMFSRSYNIPLVLVTLPLDSVPVLRNLKQIKVYLGPYQTPMIKPFAFAKISIRDI